MCGKLIPLSIDSLDISSIVLLSIFSSFTFLIKSVLALITLSTLLFICSSPILFIALVAACCCFAEVAVIFSWSNSTDIPKLDASYPCSDFLFLTE